MGSQASKGGVTAEGKAATDAASPDAAGAKTNGQVGMRHTHISSHTHILHHPLTQPTLSHTHTLIITNISNKDARACNGSPHQKFKRASSRALTVLKTRAAPTPALVTAF